MSKLGGFDVTLHFATNRLAVATVQWNPAFGKVLPLGPTIDNAQEVVSVGAFNLPDNLTANESLRTVTFVGRGVGAGALTTLAAEAADDTGRLITVHVQTAGTVQVDGKQLFLPRVGR